MLVLLSNEVDCETKMPETTRTTDSMEISLGILGEVKVYHDVNRLNVDSTSEQVSAHEAASLSVLKIMVDTVTIALLHLRMDVETRVTKLRDLLREELNSLSRIAEYDCLIDIKLGEQSVQAVQLFSLFKVGIVLGNTLKSKLFH